MNGSERSSCTESILACAKNFRYKFASQLLLETWRNSQNSEMNQIWPPTLARCWWYLDHLCCLRVSYALRSCLDDRHHPVIGHRTRYKTSEAYHIWSITKHWPNHCENCTASWLICRWCACVCLQSRVRNDIFACVWKMYTTHFCNSNNNSNENRPCFARALFRSCVFVRGRWPATLRTLNQQKKKKCAYRVRTQHTQRKKSTAHAWRRLRRRWRRKSRVLAMSTASTRI